MPRYSLCILLLLAACSAAEERSSIRVVDFIKTFDRAEKRPPAGYTLDDVDLQGIHRPSISGPSPGRIIWELPIPRHGVFHASVATDGPAPVHFRLGVSDDRIYEELAAVTVQAGTSWTDLSADLSAYAGWKWSLFYRPEHRHWRLVLSADAITGVPGHAVWGSPEIVADTASAREYATRR